MTVVLVRGCISGEGWDSSEWRSEFLDGDADSVVVDPEREMDWWGCCCTAMVFWGAMGLLVCEGAEKGALSLTMDTIIFSMSSELVWRSRLLRLLVDESCLSILGRAISRGAETEVNSMVSSSARDSTLPESWGTSFICLVSEVMFCGADWQVELAAEAVLSSFSTSCSFCHSLQLRFSNRRPCSTESAQREKTRLGLSVGCA